VGQYFHYQAGHLPGGALVFLDEPGGLFCELGALVFIPD
jgi:hypothetical protein